MKQKVLVSFLISIFIVGLTFGQKVDIDNHRFYVEYANLPSNNISKDQRTFTVEASGDSRFNFDDTEDLVSIRGWEKNNDAATVKAAVNIKNFTRGDSKVNKRVEVHKNRAGKVTGRTNYYSVSSTNHGIAYLTVYGPKNEYVPLNKKKKKKKKKKKEKKKKVNPFLKDVDIKSEEDNIPNDAEVATTANLSYQYTYTTSESKSRSTASEEYRLNASSKYSDHLSSFQDHVPASASKSLNNFYGYTRKRDHAKFKRLDSDKHPEFEMFENAVQAMRAILEKKRFNIDPSEVVEAITPVIEYFETVKVKYKQDKKHPKRLKAAAMYNMAQIYYYLDMPEKVIEIGNEYIKWDHDKGDGEDFVEKGEKLAHLLKFHDVAGRYFVTDEDADAVESEDESDK